MDNKPSPPREEPDRINRFLDQYGGIIWKAAACYTASICIACTLVWFYQGDAVAEVVFFIAIRPVVLPVALWICFVWGTLILAWPFMALHQIIREREYLPWVPGLIGIGYLLYRYFLS